MIAWVLGEKALGNGLAAALDFALLTRNCYALSTIQTGLRVDAFLLASVRVAALPAGILFVRDHTFYEGV